MKNLREKLLSAWENIKLFRQSLSLKSYFAFGGLLLLVIGLTGGVMLAQRQQENRSHASGTITLQIDPTPKVDLAKKTVTFLVRLIPTGDTPPSVVAVKLHMVLGRRMIPLQAAIAQPIFGGDLLRFISFSFHNPKVFPLEGDSPEHIPPFDSDKISPSPFPSCPPTSSLGIYGRPCMPRRISITPSVKPSITPRYPCDPVKEQGKYIPCPTRGPLPLTSSTPDCVKPDGNCTQGPSGWVCPGTNEYGIPYCGNTAQIPVLGVSTREPIVPGQSSNLTPPVSGGLEKGQGVDADEESGHLYYSVGDLYAKIVSHPVTLADLTYGITLSSGVNGVSQSDIDSLVQKSKDGTLTISFAPDTEVYGINPTGDVKQPFVKIPFIAEPATFTWASIFHTPTTPTPSITAVPSCTPLPPCFYTQPRCELAQRVGTTYCSPGTPTPVTTIVTLQMILACIDLQKPMSDPTSNYNSSACKAYSNRADADLNHDGYINGIDLNIFYRGPDRK